jgi:hypothetical protein
MGQSIFHVSPRWATAMSASSPKHHFGLTGPLRFPTRPLFMLIGRFPGANEFYRSAFAGFLYFLKAGSYWGVFKHFIRTHGVVSRFSTKLIAGSLQG